MRTIMFHSNSKDDSIALTESLKDIFKNDKDYIDLNILIGCTETTDTEYKYKVFIAVIDTVVMAYGLTFINTINGAAGSRLIFHKEGLELETSAISIPNDVSYSMVWSKDKPIIYSRLREMFRKGYPKKKIEKILNIELTDDAYKKGIENSKKERETKWQRKIMNIVIEAIVKN